PVDQSPFDVHVDVFQLDRELELALLNLLADILQGLHNLLALVLGQQPNFSEHLGMSDRTLDVVRIKAAIEADALGKPLHATVSRLVEHATPRFFGHSHLAIRVFRTPKTTATY